MMLDLRLAMVGLSQKEKLSTTGSNPVSPLAVVHLKVLDWRRPEIAASVGR